MWWLLFLSHDNDDDDEEDAQCIYRPFVENRTFLLLLFMIFSGRYGMFESHVCVSEPQINDSAVNAHAQKTTINTFLMQQQWSATVLSKFEDIVATAGSRSGWGAVITSSEISTD